MVYMLVISSICNENRYVKIKRCQPLRSSKHEFGRPTIVSCASDFVRFQRSCASSKRVANREVADVLATVEVRERLRVIDVDSVGALEGRF